MFGASFGSKSTFGSTGFGTTTPTFGSSFGSTSGGEIKDPNNGVVVQDVANEAISSLAWSPKANNLVAGAWDGSVRCWQVSDTGQSKGIGMKKHDKPVLDVCWQLDGARIFSASADNTVKMWDCASNQEAVVAKHDFAIKCVRVSDQNNKMLITGGWDHKIRYWDHKNPTGNHIAEVNVENKVYCMDLLDPMLVVGTSSRHVLVFDVRKGDKVMSKLESQLKFQLRECVCFPSQKGLLVGSIAGRFSVRYLDESSITSKNFTFKCHRVGDKIFPVNCLDFNPIHKTFLTAGSDGAFTYWDKDKKQKVKAFTALNAPITAARFSRDGKMMAYAAAYDWHKGHKHLPAGQSAKLFLRDASDAKPQ